MLFFESLSQVQAFEDVIFQMEIDDPGLRHNSFIRSLVFDLESALRIFSHKGVSYPIDTGNIYKKGSKAPLKFSTLSERKKFLLDCRYFGTLTAPKALGILNKLSECYPKEELIGFRKHGIKFHYFREYTRVKHALGLSDAVDQAMTNYGMKISFPTFKTAPLKSGAYQPSKSRIFSKIKTDPYVHVEFRFQRKSLRTRARRFDLLLHYLRVFPKKRPEKEYVKIIKLSLAGTFSKQMNQEIPEGYHEKSIKLFPDITQKKLDHVLRRKDKRVQFYFNLLQSKSLCAPVGEDMITEAYEKHFNSLCRPVEQTIPKDEDLYEKLKAYGRKVGEGMSYDPFTTTFPNAMSSIEKNRLRGGNRKVLKENGTIKTFSSHPILGLSENQVRLEPLVIGLFGPPGSGKTTLVKRLISELQYQIAPDMSREEFVYSRSCTTKHWDGYTKQPLVVLDDFGQDLEDRSDLSEFVTLVSINDYVLPMADLTDKGTKFNSLIVIVTSNMAFGSDHLRNSSNGNVVEDPIALWRRFDLPLLVDRDSFVCQEYGIDFFSPHCQVSYSKKHRTRKPVGPPGIYMTGSMSTNAKVQDVSFKEDIPKDRIAEEIMSRLHSKFDFHQRTFHDSWTQKVASKVVSFDKFVEGPIWDPHIVDVDDDVCVSNARRVYMDFPCFPPAHNPIVKTQALPEPLKVRMITIGEADTKVLQPFQKAMWSYLSSQPQFCLTNGVKELEDFEEETLPWIYRIEKVIQRIRERSNLIDEPLWLSGDYTAATDNFPMWVTEALIEGILEKIDHEPTRRWVRWEVSSHEMRYPKNVTGVQTSGQLMGSLLSFPLLCFLNDFVMKESGFDPLSYLVNGDDVVACEEMELINNWKQLAPQVGLSLSIGKNFIDKHFCTVNSQLFFEGNVLHTGKVSCQHRTGQTIGYTFQEAQFYWGVTPEVKENFLMRNWRELKNTPRSLHFSSLHGGLGLEDSCKGIAYDAKLHKGVYLYDCLHRFSQVHRVKDAPFSFVAVPLFRGDMAAEREGEHFSVTRFEKFQSLVDPMDRLESKTSDLTHSDVRLFIGKFGSLIGMEEVLRQGSFSLEDAPSRNFLQVQYLPVTNGLASRIAKESVQYALDLIREKWRGAIPLTSPFEYIDYEDLLQNSDSLSALFEDYSHENLDIVKLFCEGIPSDEDGNKLNAETLKFWKPVERLESNDGGALFEPRPQGFDDLDEFLSTFDDSTRNDFVLNEQMLSDDSDPL